MKPLFVVVFFVMNLSDSSCSNLYCLVCLYGTAHAMLCYAMRSAFGFKGRAMDTCLKYPQSANDGALQMFAYCNYLTPTSSFKAAVDLCSNRFWMITSGTPASDKVVAPVALRLWFVKFP